MSPANKLCDTTPRLPCHACTGTFALGYTADGSPLATHSLPYCAEFERISTVLEAVEFSKSCRAAEKARLS